MSVCINRVTILGHVGQEPKITTHENIWFANFQVATSEKYKEKTLTEWHQISVLNQHIIEIVRKYVHKGSKVYLEGKIQSNKYIDPNDKVEKTYTKIILSFDGKLIVLDHRAEEQYSVDPNKTIGLYQGQTIQQNKKTTTQQEFSNDEIPY